ncbi:MAG: replicative DNA helicase, partial [Lachnospiraceae bacterium]|nr:replicative DNA helicase [Lachnospiraceae bacterium]
MDEALIKRILPHSLEAEQSVIGSMILDRDAILIASEILTSEDFYQKQYGAVFDAMVELCNEGRPVDMITLQNRLKEKDLPPDISSMEYVRELLSTVPTSANVRYYAEIVSEKAVLRRLIKANEEVANACYLQNESCDAILEEAEKKLFQALRRTDSGEYVPIQQIVLNAIDNIEKASRINGSITGIPTGFNDLDFKTSGLHASDLVLVAARPSRGKTALVLNMAQRIARRGDTGVAIFSLEM